MTSRPVTVKNEGADPPPAPLVTAYFEKEAVEGLRGEPYDLWRFRRTAKALPRRFDTLLDVGCGEGCWLRYLSITHLTCRLTGVEISPTRADEARARCPGLDVRVGGFPVLPFSDGSIDVVTCLEVVEHLPDWHGAVGELLRIARRRVVVTVPYRERIKQNLCIHCHKVTPENGHLHSLSEESFSYLSGTHSVSFRRIRKPDSRFIARAYFVLFPRYRWLTVIIDVKT